MRTYGRVANVTEPREESAAQQRAHLLARVSTCVSRIVANRQNSQMNCAKTGAMRRQKHGRINNIGSILAKNEGNPRPWTHRDEQLHAAYVTYVTYGAAKVGVHAMTFYLAKELAVDGIIVNAVAPDPIASAMTSDFPDSLRALIPLDRLGRPKDVAEAIAYLASDAADFVTGEILDLMAARGATDWHPQS